MSSFSTRARMRLFNIPDEEASFARRGFHEGTQEARARLEQIGCTFLEGYRAALGDNDMVALAARLEVIDPELRGFAFEGAAMGLALRDMLAPWRHAQLPTFLNGPA